MNNTQETRITATDNPDLARKLGFNRWDADREQFVADEDYDGADYEREPGEDVEGDVPAAAVDYSTWEFRDLQAEARKRSLPATGTAEELAARLAENDAQATPEGVED